MEEEEMNATNGAPTVAYSAIQQLTQFPSRFPSYGEDSRFRTLDLVFNCIDILSSNLFQNVSSTVLIKNQETFSAFKREWKNLKSQTLKTFFSDFPHFFSFSAGDLYSGTVADFSATDSLIIKERLRTEQYDYKHLNGEWDTIIGPHPWQTEN